MKNDSKTRERLVGGDMKDASPLFYRHLAAYNFAASYVKRKKLLDLGCSDGYGSFFLARKTKSTVALDIDERIILQAKKRYKLENLNFVVGDGLNLKWRSKFDVIISFQVIEHIKEVDLYLRGIKKILTKKGFAIFSTPNRKLRLDKGKKPWNIYHIHEYDKKELHDLLSKHFSKASILGLHASKEIYELEVKRLKLRKLIAKFDLLNLYNRFPRKISDMFISSLKKLSAYGNNKQPANITIRDFWISNKNLDKALDLIAVCKI